MAFVLLALGRLAASSRSWCLLQQQQQLLLMVVVVALFVVSPCCWAKKDNDGGSFDPNSFGGGAPKFCPPFSCPKGFEPVPKWPLKIQSTGCSGIGGVSMFSPVSVGGAEDPTEHCCHARHACYQTCGSLKSHCDDVFIQCGKDTCGTFSAGSSERESCDRSTQMHELVMTMATGGGECQSFDQDQYRTCECVESSKAKEKRTRLLRNFYKKYSSAEGGGGGAASNNDEKVKKLMAKVDTARKMAGLLLKLYAKYPETIKKVKNPQQVYMEELMKGKKEPAAAKKTVVTEKEEKDDETSTLSEDLGTEEL